jgi:thioredoxin reductase (NADPH)
MEEIEKIRCLIIGSGPAGYTAAIYAARANLSPVLYEGIVPGGQLTITSEVENFPGYPDGVSGIDMMEDMRKQALRFGTDVRSGIVTKAVLVPNKNRITIDGKKEIEATTVIIATGATAKYLGLPDEAKYGGSGVSACAVCDGFFFRKKTVAIVGGGDTACEDALYLSGLCEKVYMVVRKNHFRASKILQERVLKVKNIEVLFKHQVIGLYGENSVEGAMLVKNRGEKDEHEVNIKIDGLFLAIGHNPNSGLFSEYLKTDETGYIKTIPGTPKTEIPGVYAAGDVADPRYRQAVVAAANGCKYRIARKRHRQGVDEFCREHCKRCGLQ